MRALLYIPGEAIRALLFAASIGILTGALASILSHRMEDGLQAGFAGSVIAFACLGRNIWRAHREEFEELFLRRRTLS